jgi:hypothetical protein
MRVLITPAFADVRPGIEARSPLLELVGHGHDHASATDSLAKAVKAWCLGLEARGELESALRARGVRWDPTGTEMVIEILNSPLESQMMRISEKPKNGFRTVPRSKVD